MRLLLLLASAAAISKVPKAPTAGRAAAIGSKTPQKPTTGRAAAKAQAEQAKPLALSGGGANKQVSYAWAVLHNWLYFLSLGLCIPVLPEGHRLDGQRRRRGGHHVEIGQSRGRCGRRRQAFDLPLCRCFGRL